MAMLALLLPSLACAVRRLPDTDRSGWWLLLGLVPFVGAIILIVFYCLEGTKGPNRFGADPIGDVQETFASNPGQPRRSAGAPAHLRPPPAGGGARRLHHPPPPLLGGARACRARAPPPKQRTRANERHGGKTR